MEDETKTEAKGDSSVQKEGGGEANETKSESQGDSATSVQDAVQGGFHGGFTNPVEGSSGTNVGGDSSGVLWR